MTPTSQSARMGTFSAILEKALLGVRQSKDPITSSTNGECRRCVVFSRSPHLAIKAEEGPI